MDRRRGAPARPASSEELECWSHAATSLKELSDLLSTGPTSNILGRVNRSIASWPADDIIPAEGYESVKTNAKRLTHGLEELKEAANAEVKAIEEAIERVGVLMALRKAPEVPSEKRNKRPRASSPSGTPVPSAPSQAVSRGVSITLPPRTSTGPALLPFSRDAKARRDTLARQPQLQQGRKVVFHPPPQKNANGTSGDAEETTWIVAVVIRCINPEKHKYEVQDPEPQDDGQPGAIYTATPKNMIPLPDLMRPRNCFYRAEVIATPKELQNGGRHLPMYKLKFEDDEDQEQPVAAQWVVELPVGN
ncbi:hypothetical protein BDQ17DRAFT_1343382 [Cyathus striatus]|nr:hypothetical protein BDQ17DRAFT_1343382 [Cyathus striatus]